MNTILNPRPITDPNLTKFNPSFTIIVYLLHFYYPLNSIK